MNTPTPAGRAAPEIRHLLIGLTAFLVMLGALALWDPAASHHERLVHATPAAVLLLAVTGAAAYDHRRGQLAERLAALPGGPGSARRWPVSTIVLSAAVIIAVVPTVLTIRRGTSHVTALAAYAAVVGLLVLMLRVALHAWDGRIPGQLSPGSSPPPSRVVTVAEFAVTLGVVALFAVGVAVPRIGSRDRKAARCAHATERFQSELKKLSDEVLKLNQQQKSDKISQEEYLARLRALSARRPAFTGCQPPRR